MTLLLVKATLAMLIALGVAALLRRARASLRHAVFAALFAFLLLLPFSPRVLPKMDVPVPAAQQTLAAPAAVAPPAITSASSRPPAAAAHFDLVRTLADVYLAGIVLLLASLASGIVRLRRIAASGEVWLDGTRLATDIACANGIRRAVLVVISDEISVPMTFGFRRQTIVVPAAARDWDEDALRRALRHELEHVRRDDWALQLLARVTCAFYWPHPLVWVAWRRFGAEAERACDDAVVHLCEAATYAEQLVTLARTVTRQQRVPALAMASPTRLAERVHAILDPAQRRGPHGRAASVTTVAVMAGVLALFGSVRLVAAATPDEPRHEMDRDETDHDGVIGAAADGDTARLETEMARGLYINHTFDGDGTMLLIAARGGKLDAVRYLLDRGADPNVPSEGDGNPLIAAAGAGHAGVVALLLDRGARIDEVVPGDETALITAAARGRADVVQLLISRGADVNLGVWVEEADGRPRERRTPLRMARRHGNPEVIRMLLAAGAHE